MPFLKQSTAAILKLGPFLDDTDGKTAETGLTIAQADIQISKNGGAFAQTSAATPTTTHDADGWYPIPLTTTDTGTLGTLVVQVTMSGALPVWSQVYDVVPANVWDSLVGGTDELQTDAGLTPLASGTAQSGGATTIQLASGAVTFDNQYRYCIVNITGGTGVGQSAYILSSVASTDTLTVSQSWATNPASGSTYEIWGFGVLVFDPDTDKVTLAAATHTGAVIPTVTTVGSVTGAVASVTGAVGSVTGAVGSVAGNVDGNVTGTIGELAAQAKTDVNEQVADVLKVDTVAELAADPGATPTIEKALMLLYMALRNAATATSAAATIKNDAGATVLTKALSDDSTTFTAGKVS
jgi:hypothetical protein